MLRGGGNGARKGHGQGVGGKRREREEAREGRGAGEAKDRTRNGAVPGRAHFGRAHNNINNEPEREGARKKGRGDGGEDKSGRRRRQEERSAGKTGGTVGGEDRRSGRRGRQEERTAGKAGRNGKKTTENDKKRQDAARQPVGLATSGLQRITPEKPAFPPRRITDCNRKNENISPKIPLFQKNTYLC